MIFDKAVQLLHNHKLRNRLRKIPDLLLGHRPDHAQLQNRVCIAERLLHILIAGGGGDNTHGLIASVLDPVDLGRLRPCGQRPRALLHQRMFFLRICRHHNIFRGILLILLRLRHDPLPRLHNALGMADAGAHLHQHRRVKLLGKLIGKLRKSERLRRIGRLQHGNLRRPRIMSGILLVLGTVHPGVVRHAND